MAYNKKAVLAANTEAIRVVLRLEKEHRPATEAEKRILRGYQGFGGLKCVLNRTDTPDDALFLVVAPLGLLLYSLPKLLSCCMP